MSETSSSVKHPQWIAWPLRWLPRGGLQLSERRALLIAGDAVAAAAATALALGLWALTSGATLSAAFLREHWYWFGVLVSAWLVLNLNLYDLRNAASKSTTMRSLLVTASLALGLYLVVFFLAPRGLLPRLFILYFVTGALCGCLVWRLVYMTVFFSPYFQRRVLVVGAGWAGETIVRALTKYQPRQYAVVGLIDDDHSKHGQTVSGMPVMGGYDRLLPAVKANRVSEVVLAINGEIQGATFQALLDCQAQGIPVTRMSSVYEQITGRVPLEHLNADWVITSFMDKAHQGRWTQLAQRGLDIAGALLGLLGLGLLYPAVSAAVWLESRGPILYRQTRLSQGGRPFEMLKFRTMVPDAEADGQARWASPDDERVTRVGRFLRRARLDEAPHFWNVVKGEMSLEGPRPERPEFIAALEKHIPFYRARLMVKPGLTGWAQVNFGYGDSIEDMFVKLQYDLYYIKHHSLWLDLLILARTVGVVLRFQGR